MQSYYSVFIRNHDRKVYYITRFFIKNISIYLDRSGCGVALTVVPSVLSEKKMTMKFRLTLISERDCQARKQKPCRDLRTTADISDLYIRPVQTLINFNISLPSAPIPVWPGLTHITNSNHFKEKNLVTLPIFQVMTRMC